MHNYPSDVTREQFKIIRPDLESAKKKTCPRKYDLYDIFCAVLYVLRGGIQWRMLPKNFPNWKLVYCYFTVWSKTDENGNTLLDKILKKKLERLVIKYKFSMLFKICMNKKLRCGLDMKKGQSVV